MSNLKSIFYNIFVSDFPLLSSVLLSSIMVSMVATLLELAFMSTPLVKTTLEILPFTAPLLAPDWLASESFNEDGRSSIEATECKLKTS